MEKVPQKLHAKDYTFSINDIDITHTSITYDIFEYSWCKFVENKKGEKVKKRGISRVLQFFLDGKDYDERHGSIKFQINMLQKDLKKLPLNKITDLTKYLRDYEPYFYEPGVDGIGFMTFRYPKNDIEDMYSKFTSLFGYRIDENNFVFKFDNPYDNIFAAFKVTIDD